MLLTDSTADSAGKAMSQSGRERALIGTLVLVVASLDERENENDGKAKTKTTKPNTRAKCL